MLYALRELGHSHFSHMRKQFSIRRWLSSVDPQRGSVVEASIVLPTLIILVITILIYGFVLLVQASLDRSVVAGLNLAVTTGEFENDPEDCYAEDHDPESPFCQEVRRIEQHVLDTFQESLILDSLVSVVSGPEIDLPIAGAGENQDKLWSSEPIRVRMEIALDYFWFDFVLEGLTGGFRETRRAYSNPVKHDCNGFPIGSIQYEDYDNYPCDCSQEGPNAIFDPVEMTCYLCPDNTFPPGVLAEEHRHNPPQYDDKGCECPNTTYCTDTYGPGVISDWYYHDQCGCDCNSGSYYRDEATPGDLSSCVCREAPASYQPTDAREPFVFGGSIENPESPANCICVGEDQTPMAQADCESFYPTAVASGVNFGPVNNKCFCYCYSSHCPTGMKRDSADPNFDAPHPTICPCVCSTPEMELLYDGDGTPYCECAPCEDGLVHGDGCNCVCDPNLPDCGFGRERLPQSNCACDCTPDPDDPHGRCLDPGGDEFGS